MSEKQHLTVEETLSFMDNLSKNSEVTGIVKLPKMISAGNYIAQYIDIKSAKSHGNNLSVTTYTIPPKAWSGATLVRRWIDINNPKFSNDGKATMIYATSDKSISSSIEKHQKSYPSNEYTISKMKIWIEKYTAASKIKQQASEDPNFYIKQMLGIIPNLDIKRVEDNYIRFTKYKKSDDLNVVCEFLYKIIKTKNINAAGDR